jgi:CHAD domain-containing protein
MNKAVDESWRLFAARYLRKQTKQLTGQLDGVRRGEDIEYVHRARVASRRLREARVMFRDCFDAGTWKRWRKEVRRLTAGLGDARDKDVQIAFLTGLLAETQREDCCLGIALVLARLERRRERVQPEVVQALDRFEASGVGGQILAVAKKTLDASQKQELEVASEAVFSRAEEAVGPRLEELLSHEASLADPEDQAGHHELRIAAKRLRYTLEICKLPCGQRVDEFIAAAKQLQSLLGEIHDCDVWIEHLDKTLGRIRKRINSYYGHDAPAAPLEAGIEYLRDQRREERRRCFDRLDRFWEELRGAGTWQNLIPAIRGRAPQRPLPEVPANTAATNVEHKRAIDWQRLEQADEEAGSRPMPDPPDADILLKPKG